MAIDVCRPGPVLALAVTIFVSLQTSVRWAPDSSYRTNPSPGAPVLDPRIPVANPEWFSNVPFRRWPNPLLEVSAAGITLKAASVQEALRTDSETLGNLLTALPRTDWPLGRVVVIAGPSIGPGDAGWWKAVDENLTAAIEVAKALGVVPYVAAS